MQPQSFSDLQPKVVLGVAAHPDDLDFAAGGTLATFAAQGAAVYYLQLTDGCKGSEDRNLTTKIISQQRQNEQKAACEIVGGAGVHFLDYCDGELQDSIEVKTAIVKAIRQLKPDVVITTDPNMLYAAQYGIINHADHRAAGQATLDAVYPLARDHLALPELLQQGFEPHKVSTVLLINLENSNFCIDITAKFETKLAAIRAHASQVDHDETVVKIFTELAEKTGAENNSQYAEGFMRIDIAT